MNKSLGKTFEEVLAENSDEAIVKVVCADRNLEGKLALVLVASESEDGEHIRVSTLVRGAREAGPEEIVALVKGLESARKKLFDLLISTTITKIMEDDVQEE
jgi:hypothetical protein